MSKGLCPKCRKVISSSSRMCEHCGTMIKLENIPIEKAQAYPLKKVWSQYKGLFFLQHAFVFVGGVIFAISLPVSLANRTLCIWLPLGIIIMGISIPFAFRLNRYWLQMLLEHDYAMLPEEEKAKLKNDEKEINSGISFADEIKKYKELLDSGIITQEEFNTKKKQLLDL